MAAKRTSAAPFSWAAGAAAVASVLFVVAPVEERLWSLAAAPLVATAVIIVVVLRRRPARPVPWLLLAVALLAAVHGSVIQATHQSLTTTALLGFVGGSIAVGGAIIGFTTPVPAERDPLA